MKIIRPGTPLLLTLAISSLPCCRDEEDAEYRRPNAVLIAAMENRVCTYRWDGVPVSQDALLQRGVHLITETMNIEERHREAQLRRGTIEEYDTPSEGRAFFDLRLEAARDLPYSCFGPALRVLERSGLPEVTLRLAGERLADQRVFFDGEPYGPGPRYSAVVQIAGSGHMYWNGEAIDLSRLRERLRATDRQRPDDVAVAPANDAVFKSFYATLWIIGQTRTMPILLRCIYSPGAVPVLPAGASAYRC